MPDPLDDLRAAAKLLRDRAEAATPGPWSHVDHGKDGAFNGCGQVITWGEGVEGGDIAAPSGDLYPRGGYSPMEDMAYIATVHPGVGLALADWLESVVVRWVGRAELNYPARHVFQQHALRVARLILGEAADAR